jgi:hypothetical protein
MKRLFRVLKFFRLIDRDRNLSLTNISLWITLVHLVYAKDVVGPTDLGALLAALASYQTKRFIQQNGTK